MEFLKKHINIQEQINDQSAQDKLKELETQYLTREKEYQLEVQSLQLTKDQLKGTLDINGNRGANVTMQIAKYEKALQSNY